MLQQTQVVTVIPYYTRWMEKYVARKGPGFSFQMSPTGFQLSIDWCVPPRCFIELSG